MMYQQTLYESRLATNNRGNKTAGILRSVKNQMDCAFVWVTGGLNWEKNVPAISHNYGKFGDFSVLPNTLRNHHVVIHYCIISTFLSTQQRWGFMQGSRTVPEKKWPRRVVKFESLQVKKWASNIRLLLIHWEHVKQYL